jgi:hypothetical protein
MFSLHDDEENEQATKRVDDVPSATLLALSRIGRLAEVARERLTVAPDDEALATACTELAEIEALAKAVSS